MTVTPLPLDGVARVVRRPVGDARGFLARLFCADTLAAAGWTGPVAQVNHTHTAQRGTVRGLHLQHPPHAEWKLVSCVRGAVWDVAVDLRAGSPTLGAWHGETLSADNHAALLIPPGCAHGFQALTDDVELLYVHSAPWVPSHEAGVRPDDPRLGIPWPLPITVRSARDAGHPLLPPDFTGFPS